MAANGPVSVRYQGVVMKSFYGHVLIGVLGLMYFCSSGVILPAANVVNPLMLVPSRILRTFPTAS